MPKIVIQTKLNTAAEAHVLGQGYTEPLEGASVLGTPNLPGNVRVRISVPDEHVNHVLDLLDSDDRVFSYSFI